jgi:hypothetical protein
MPLSPFNHPLSSNAGGTVARSPESVATIAALKAVAASDPRRTEDNIVALADGSRWRFRPASTATGDDILVVAPTAGTGRWCRAEGFADLALPFTYATADGATLLTLPAGCRIFVQRGYWEITVAMAGGSSSAIGLAGPSPHNTAGDLLGGAAGDVEATLTAGTKLGTIGADQAVGIHLAPTNTVTFERITSAFTSGSGNAHLLCMIVSNPGA